MQNQRSISVGYLLVFALILGLIGSSAFMIYKEAAPSVVGLAIWIEVIRMRLT